MPDQTTEVTTEEVTTDVQPDSIDIDDLLENIADGLVDEEPENNGEKAEPAGEVDHEVKPEKPEEKQEPKPKPETHKVKVDGAEVEVDYSELVKGYQTSRHNTQTAQQLAEEKRQLAPLFGLAERLKDPEFAKHVFSYGKTPEPDISDDPIALIRADAEKAAEAKVDARFKAKEDEALIANIEGLRAKVQADQHYEAVQAGLADYVKSLPAAIRKQAYDALDRDPATYAEMYSKIREKVVPKEEDPAKEPERKKPPALVNPGNTGDVPLKTIRKQKIDKKRAEILKSGDADALEEYFMMDGGLIDSLGL